MQYSKLQSSASQVSAFAVLSAISSVSALEMLAAADKYEWDTNLSCHQCIRSDFVYVYENSATGQYFKEIPRTEANTGFCCRKEANANTYQCEKPPAGPDPRIAAMWTYYGALTATSTNKALMLSYMNRLKNFEKDGQSIYDFYLNKLIDLHAKRLEVEATATAAGTPAAVDDGAGFTALLDQLKPRVVYAEFSNLLGRGKAIEYLQYIEIIKTYIGVTGPGQNQPAIEAAGAGDDMITADLTTLRTGNANAAFADDANFLTKITAQARIDAAKDKAVWDDVEKIIGNTKTTEFKALIAEVATKESITASQVYIDYIYKAFDIQNTASYEIKLKEIRKRIANLRFRTCLTLADAIAFNKLWVEMETYENQRGDDALVPGPGLSSIIIATGYTDNYIMGLVQNDTAAANTAQNKGSWYTTELARLKLEVLWYYVEWNTNKEMVADMKTYYTRYDTYASVSNTLTTRETAFQGHKDDYRGPAQQDGRFKTDYDALRVDTYKAAVTYFMANDPNTNVAGAGPALYTILTGQSAWQLGVTINDVRTIEDGFYNKPDAANASAYATKYRNHYWAKLEEALTRYWKNKNGAINRSTQQVDNFFNCWKGLTADWDTVKTQATPQTPSLLAYSDLKAFYTLAAADNVAAFNTRIQLEYKTAYWRRAELINWTIGVTADNTHNLPDFQTGIINVIHASDTNLYYQPTFLNKNYLQYKTDMSTAYYNEQREKLRYEWATSNAANMGLTRVKTISNSDATRYKQKIDQRYSSVAFAQHVNVAPATGHTVPPAYGSAQWIARDAYIDTLITNLNNLNKGVDASAANAGELTEAWFLTNMEDTLDLDIWKNVYIGTLWTPSAAMKTNTQTYYDEWGGAATMVNGTVTVTGHVTERRALIRGFVDATSGGENWVKVKLGQQYYETLKYRCDQLITSNDATGVWITTNIKTDFTEILDEINAVTGTRWDDGYNWYVKGLSLLEATDATDFTEAVMKSTIKTLREELLQLYYKKWDEYDQLSTGRATNTGRAAQMFALLDYIPTTIEAAAGVVKDQADYDREKYISLLYDAKHADSDEDLDGTEDIEVLRTYEQIYGELTARVDKAFTDILEKIIELNGNNSPTHAHVEVRLESVNFIRFDLYESTLYKTDVLNNAASMATFSAYQGVVKANLMDKLSSYSSGSTAVANVAIYDAWARMVDESYIACMLLGAGFGNVTGPFSHAVTNYGTWNSNTAYGGTKLGKYFYSWTYTDLEDTSTAGRINNVSSTPTYTALRAGLDDIMTGLRTYTVTTAMKDKIHEGLREVLYFWLDRRMATSQDATFMAKWIKALGGNWTGSGNTNMGLDHQDVLTVALTYATTKDWSTYNKSNVYDNATNFYYVVLDAACTQRIGTDIPGYNSGTDDPFITKHTNYKTALMKLSTNPNSIASNQYSNEWKTYLDSCYDKEQAHDLVFTTLDTSLKTYWAYVVAQVNQTYLTTLYAATDYTSTVSDCDANNTNCTTQSKAAVLSNAQEAQYVRGIWDTTDTVLWNEGGGATYSDKAKAGYLIDIFWTAISDENWDTTLNTSVASKSNHRASLQVPQTANENAWTLTNIRDFVDNCELKATPDQASKQSRWEYFASSESATAGGWVNVGLGSNGSLLEITQERAVQHMLMTCITDIKKGLASSSTYQSTTMAMTDLTSTGLKAWYDTQMTSLTSNANWTNTYTSGTANYYRQMFWDQTLTADSNVRNTLASQLVVVTKNCKEGPAASGTAAEQTKGKVTLDHYAEALNVACKNMANRKSYTTSIACTLLNLVATKQYGSSSKQFEGHGYLKTLADSMVAVADDTAFSSVEGQAFYNEIRVVDCKMCVSYQTGMITYKANWIYTMTSLCLNSTDCTGATMTTFWGKYKVTAAGSVCGTDDAANRKTLVTVMITTMKAVWDVQVTVINSNLVSTANFNTMWTAVQASTNFDVTTSDATAYAMITNIAPTTNFSSAYQAAGDAVGTHAAKTTQAHVATTYDTIAQKSYEFEIAADTGMDNNGNATHGTELMKKLFTQMKSITWTGQVTNENCATEYARTNMGTIDGTAAWTGSEMRMMCDHWTYLTKKYYLDTPVTDNSAQWQTENAAVVAGDLNITDYTKWYYTNNVGWDARNVAAANDGGKALTNSMDYYDGGSLSARLTAIKLVKVNIYDDKVRAGTITETSLQTDWTVATWGLYAKQATNWNVNNALTSTYTQSSANDRGRVYRWEAIVDAEWNDDTIAKMHASMQTFSNFLYFEYFLDSETLLEYKEMRAVINAIDTNEATAPFNTPTTYYEDYYATQFKECYQEFVVNADATYGRKMPNEWEVDYKTVSDCYQRWLGRIRFHLWNDLEEYVVSRRALGSNIPTLASATLWSYRDTLRARYTFDYWKDTPATTAKTSFTNFKTCTSASSPTCASVMSSLTASGDSHPVVALTDGTDNVTYKIAGKKNSKDFAHPTWQLAACPHLEKNCGKKNIHLRDSRSSPVEIGINMFDSASSCHWLISAKCALPAVNIFDQTDGIEGNLIAEFVEWQTGVVKTDTLGYPKDVLTVVPKKYNKPWFDDAGSRPAALQETTKDLDPKVFDKEISVELLLNTLASKRSQVEFYNLELALYNLDLEIWDNAVVFAKAKYNNQIAKNKQAAAAGPSEGGILDQILGAFGTTAEAAAADPKDRELIELPEKPSPPDQPSPYRGKGFKDIRADIGYGTLTEGLMSLRSDYGTKKFFGVTGQGFEVDTELGFTFTPDLLNATKSWSDPAIAGCNNKYIALSIYPKKKEFFQGPDRLRMMITAEEPADLNFDKPEKTVAAKPPQPGPSQTLINQFYDSWEEFDEAMSGAASLGAGLTTAAALIAATLC